MQKSSYAPNIKATVIGTTTYWSTDTIVLTRRPTNPSDEHHSRSTKLFGKHWGIMSLGCSTSHFKDIVPTIQ